VFTYDWNFRRVTIYADAFAHGLLVTILLSLATVAFATAVGLLWGVALNRSPRTAAVTLPLVDLLKALPPLVVILFGYFFFSRDVMGFSVPAFWTFVLSLGLNLAAFIADLTRAAISNTPTEYIEAGRALGFAPDRILRTIVAPLAFRELLPSLSYLYIEAIKLTSLASVISVRETVYVAQSVIVDTVRSLEVWTIVAAIYLVLIVPLTWLARNLEFRLKRTVGFQLHW
jgi:polar amino acid transport system permease protein